MSADTYKRAAAARAVDFVRSGMRLGLGTGSTAAHFVELLAERVRTGLDVLAVPTSEATRALAEKLGIPLTTLDETPELDLTVDGADEIAPDLTLIKGGGGALLREKIVAAVSARLAAEAAAAAAGSPGPIQLRRDRGGHAFVTDGGHWLLDAQLQRIADPPALARSLADVPGVMEHGLFIGLAQTAILAGPEGVRLVERP